MRAYDWRNSALGPVEAWPKTLRTALAVMLECRFPMIVAWGPELRLFYNDRYRPILGRSKQARALGAPAREIFAETWDALGPAMELARSGQGFAVDDWNLALDREGYLENCWFSLSYSPIRDDTGAVGGLLAVVVETTARVDGERRLATLRGLASGGGEAASQEHALRRAARILERNRIDFPFALLYSFAEETGLLHRVGNVGLPAGHPANVDAHDASGPDRDDGWPLTQVLRTGRAVVLTDLPARFQALSGGPYREHAHTAVVLPLGRPGGHEPYGVLVAGVCPRRALDDGYRAFLELARDHIVTGVHAARSFEAERKRAAALAELDRAKTAFFSNVSHEFRTPLSLVLSPLQELLAGMHGAIPEKQRRELELACRNALRLQRLVGSVLDFARIEARRLEPVFEPTDLAELTADLCSMFRSTMEAGGLKFIVNTEPLPEPVWVDREMWEKIVLNLLSNAFKFTLRGRIEVRLEPVGNSVLLTVADTGEGIEAAELPKIFERFHRIAGVRSRSAEGAGIGLTLVQELTRLLGGSVEVQSEPGKGTVFSLRLRFAPALPPEQADRSRGDGNSSAAAASVEQARAWLPDELSATESESSPLCTDARVLVVDDNRDMREYLARLLSRRWSVQAVGDAESALEVLRDDPVDCVVADVMLPNLDGFGLLDALRRDPRTRDIRVILLSARAGEETCVRSLGVGADDYLSKPFGARELVCRVASQIALARAQRDEERRRAELYGLFMQAPAPIFVARGGDLTYEMANQLFSRLMGSHRLLGHRLEEATPQLAEHGDLLRRVMSLGQPEIVRELRLPYARTEGAPREDAYWTILYAPLRNGEGIVDRVMAICNEVTDPVRSRCEAEAANRTKDDFMALLGHELRNPLAPILSAIELMRLKNVSSVERERQVIERQVRHMVQLVDDLLDVSRITLGKVELRLEPLEIFQVIGRAIEVTTPLLEQRRHQLSVAVPASGLRVRADPLRLSQVFANLLTNAAKYTPEGGRIEVEASARDGRAVVTVRDNGAGIAPAMLDRIFEPFVQEERSRDGASGGLGLGLPLVRSLLALHDGRVRASSKGSGRGSEFVVDVPLLGRSSPPPRHVDEPGAPRSTISEPGRLLVVDDNADAAEMIAEGLRMKGYDVRVANDASKALSVARSFVPDFAVLDIGLPGMDGYELGRRLRALLGDELTLVAVSGYAPKPDERLGETLFAAHLVKPIDLERLQMALEDARRHEAP